MEKTNRERWLELNEIIGFTAPLEKLLTMYNKKPVLDIIKLDNMFGHKDQEYNPIECTYQDAENISIFKYVEMKFGKKAAELINSLL